MNLMQKSCVQLHRKTMFKINLTYVSVKKSSWKFPTLFLNISHILIMFHVHHIKTLKACQSLGQKVLLVKLTFVSVCNCTKDNKKQSQLLINYISACKAILAQSETDNCLWYMLIQLSPTNWIVFPACLFV